MKKNNLTLQFDDWFIIRKRFQNGVRHSIKEVKCCYVCDLPSVTDCMHLRNSGDGTRD